MHHRNHTIETDEQFLRSIVASYSNNLLHYALYYVRHKEEAEEIVSDVFLEVWQNREKIGEIQNMKAWLVTITHNKTISYLRKKDYLNQTVSWDEIDEFTMPIALQTPDEQIISKEEMEQINGIINNLPPKCKQVFVLAKIERLPYKEIAVILNISVKTINIHISKALEKISSALKK